MDLGWPEVLLILVVVLIVFGVGRLPQVGGAIGRGLREFRKAQHGDYDDEKETPEKAAHTTKEEPQTKQVASGSSDDNHTRT
jgi:sec-independent protein translocase protein TatA